MINHAGRVGFGASERAYSVESKFTKHFIEFVFMEMNQLFGRNSNVILSQQTCGQRWLQEAYAER